MLAAFLMNGRYAPYAFALLRIMAGAMFLIHGSGKILNIPPSDMHPPIASMGGIGGIIELICGLLITIGLFAHFAAFIASGEMAVAYFYAHFPHGWNPVANHGESAVLYCFVFLYIAAHGAGIWSIDSMIGKGRTTRRA